MNSTQQVQIVISLKALILKYLLVGVKEVIKFRFSSETFKKRIVFTSSYGDLNSAEISQKVQDAHLRVLEDFETDTLIELMMRRLGGLQMKQQGLPEWLNPENVYIGGLEELLKFN